MTMSADARGPAGYRLFCFPFAGGGATSFRKWQTLLPRGVEVCPVRLPGRDARVAEPSLRRMAPLVADLLGGLREQLHGPFALFGHSMGALVAFEVARQLRREGCSQPRQLFVAGFRGPHLPEAHPAIHSLPDSDFRTELRRLGATPAAVLDDPELMEVLLPRLRADFAVCETYSYATEPPLACPITVFAGRDDPEVSEAELLGWRQHTDAAFTIQWFDGDHFFLNAQAGPLVRSILQALRP